MNVGRTVLSQLMGFVPFKEFRRIVKHHRGEHRVRHFSCWEQYLAMALAQLTYRESLRDIEACLRSLGPTLYHADYDPQYHAQHLPMQMNAAHGGFIRTWRSA